MDGKYVEAKVAAVRKEEVVDNTCDDSTWTAARTRGKKYEKKDVCGLMLATCRHVLVHKALDMSRGEIYAYPYILQVLL